MRNYKTIIIFFLIPLLILSCSHARRTARWVRPSSPPPVRQKPALELMGYTIQAGAFKKVENAVRLTERLKNNHGLDATYFLASDKFFKVRFGNFTTKELARKRAQSLKEAKIIEEFYVVQPEDYSVARQKQYGANYLREALVKTAKDFIGVPYLWGGASFDDGFDCSGLTMTVYQLMVLTFPATQRNNLMPALPSIKMICKKATLYFFLGKEEAVFLMSVFI